MRQMIQQSQFTPSGRQVRARNKFYSQANVTGTEIDSAAQSLELGAPARISDWWAIPGFAEWWCSPTWEREESHRLLISAMHRVSEVLRDEDDSARLLAAAREAREIYTKLNGPEQKEKYMDSEIGEMGPEELKEFIKRNSQVNK